MAQGKVQPNTSQKFKFVLNWVFLGPNSEYACVNFFAHILTSLISRDFLFQLTQAENADVVANCDRIQNLTAPPKPGGRPIATSLSYVARFADAFPVAAMVSTLSEKSFRRIEQLASPFLQFPVVALPGVGHMPANGEEEKEVARVFYVAAARATQRLVMGIGVSEALGSGLISELVTILITNRVAASLFQAFSTLRKSKQ